jgi:hypothetical protein
LADEVPPVAVRLRRDFRAFLSFIEAHAILHQVTRERDSAGRIIATLDDYAVVRELVADLISEGVGATVGAATRETVVTVEKLARSAPNNEVSNSDLARELKLDSSVISRRVQVALKRGYLRNSEDRKGRPYRLVLGDPLPEQPQILPTVERLHELLLCCSVDEGDLPPSPSPDEEEEEGWEYI